MHSIPFGFVDKTGLFDLGAVVGTPGAIDALQRTGISARTLLQRHISGDWGDIHPEDVGLNEQALVNGERIMSVYTLSQTGETVWVITEWDRSITTLLLPTDY